MDTTDASAPPDSARRTGRARVLVAGAGLMGRWHAHAARRAGAHVVAIVDPDASRAQLLARRAGRAQVYPRLAPALAACAPIDVVHVCTPLATHFELAALSLEAGAHVLVEKPLTADFADAERLVAIAGRRRRVVCPVLQWRFQRGVRDVLSRSHVLGRLVHAEVVLCSAGAVGRTAAESDAVAGEILPHPLSILEMLLPGGIRGVAWDVTRPRDGELRVSACAGDASVSILVSLAARPTEATLRLRFERGTAHADLFHGSSFVEPGAVSRTRKILRPFDESARRAMSAGGNLVRRAVARRWAYPGLEELVREFLAAAACGAEPPIPDAVTLAVSYASAEIASRVPAHASERRRTPDSAPPP